MWRTSIVLLATAAACLGQSGRPTILPQPNGEVIPFTGVTITAPSYATNSLTFTLNAVVSPITSYRWLWTPSGNPPFGGMTLSTPQSTNTSVTVLGPGNYDFVGTARAGMRRAEVTVSVAVNVAQNAAPTISTIANVVTNEDFSTATIPFTVSDDQTAPAGLTILAVSSNPNLLPNSGISIGGSGANRNIKLTPLPNSNGVATVTISVTDGSSSPATTTTSFTATWLAVNDIPQFLGVPASVIATEDVTPVVFSHGVFDVETPAGVLVETATSDNPAVVTNIVVTGAGTSSRTITIDLIPNAFGAVNIDLALTDNSATVHRIVPLTVTPVNDTPSMSLIADAQMTNGVATQINFVISDVEDGGNLALSRTSDNPAVIPVANIVFGGSGFNRSATLTPVGAGTANVTFTATDSGGLQTARTFKVLVGVSGNTAPSISDPGAQATLEDTPKIITYTIADAETPVANLVLHATSSDQALLPDSNLVLGGTTGTRTLTLTPVANAHGSLTLTTYVVDSGGLSSTNTLTLTITSVNDCPVFPSISSQSTAEDVPKAVAFSISDVDGDTLTVTGTSTNTALVSNDASHITFTGSGNNRTVTLTPLLNQTGQTTIILVVDDGAGCTVTNSFIFSVGAVNDPPVLAAIGPQSTVEDVATSPITLTISDPESAASALTLSAVSSNPALAPASGFTFAGSGGSRTLTILPATNQSGTATITVSCSDGTNSVQQSFTLTVTAVNDAPTIANVPNQTLVQGATSAQATATVNDVDTAIGSLTLSATTSDPSVLPLSGITFSGAGTARTVTFTPSSVGTATVTLTVSDGALTATTPSFTVTKPAPINSPPSLTLFPNQTTPEDTDVLNLPITVSDLETPAANLGLSVSISNPSVIVSVVLGGSGSSRLCSIHLVPNASGVATLTFTLSDGSAQVQDARTITVTPVNDAPVFTSAITPKTLQAGTTLLVNTAVSDVETAAGSLGVTATVVSGTTVSITGLANNNGAVSFTLNGSATGSNTVQVVVSDGALTATNTFAVTVTPAPNTNPTITGLVNRTIAQGATDTQTVTVGDAESGAASVTLSVQTSNSTLVPTNNVVISGSGASRTIVVTPVASQSGTAVVTIIARDPQGGTASQAYTLTVTPSGGRVFFAAPNGVGSASNTGLTQSSPWNIGSVQAKATKGLLPGDTVWLLDGVYPGRYVFTGQYAPGHIIFRSLNRNFLGKGAIFDRQNASSGDGAIDFGQGSSGIWFWDLTGDDTTPRLPPQTGTDRGNPLYIVWRGENNKVINCHLFNGANGIGVEDDASIPAGNFEIYGCWTAYNGEWLDDCAHGHGAYLQPKHPTDSFLVSDCFSHNNQGQGLQARTGDQSITLHNLEVNGFVSWNNGLPCGGPSRNFFSNAGGDVDFNFKFRSNITYYAGQGGPGGLWAVRPETDSGHIGSPANIHQNLLMDYNFVWHGDVRFGRWTPMNVYSNEFISTSQRFGAIFLTEFGVPPGIVNFNTMRGPQPYAFDVGGSDSSASQAQWQAKGYGANDIVASGDLPATRVWVRPNKYDAKLIHVIVANPSGGASVNVVIPQMANGQAYDCYSATDPDVKFSSGVYGGSITLPMTGFHMRPMVQCTSGCGTMAGISGEPFFNGFVFVLN